MGRFEWSFKQGVISYGIETSKHIKVSKNDWGLLRWCSQRRNTTTIDMSTSEETIS